MILAAGWKSLKMVLVLVNRGGVRMSTFATTFKGGGKLYENKLKLLRTAICCLDQQKGVVDYDSYVFLLRECSNLKALSEGRRVHMQLGNSGFSRDNYVNNLLVDMYAKCESLQDARLVFDSMLERDIVSWNLIISAYSRQGHCREALLLFEFMQREGLTPNKITLVIVLNACANLAALQEGMSVHSDIISMGCASDVVLGTALFKMYAKCGKMDAAFTVFKNMPMRDVIAWNAMIATYANEGDSKAVLQLFRQMQQHNVKPNRVTFLSLLNAFAGPRALSDGKLIHAYAVHGGFELDCAVGNALISMYARCGSIKDAQGVFAKMPERDVVSWTAMIMANTKVGQNKAALELFWEMKRMGVQPNKITFLSLLNSCVGPEALAEGRIIHACITDSGFEQDFAVRNALISMYGKCGSLENARAIFNKMSERDVVSWNAMICAYAQNGNGKAAIQLFNQMELGHVKADRVTLASILDVCTSMRYLSKGKQLHAYIVRIGLESDVFVGTALLHFYAECGSLEDVQYIFDKMPKRDVVSWTAIIAAHSRHGVFMGALHFFAQMQQEGLMPNKVSYIGVLSACSHAGLVDECFHYYVSIETDLDMSPTTEHFGCLIDVLARAGRLDEAEKLIQNMPLQPDAVIWMTLLGACSLHGDVDRGLRAAKQLLEMDPGNTATYVALSNIYAKARKWDDVVRSRKAIADKCPRKPPGCSLMEVQNKLYKSVVRCKTDPQARELNVGLKKLSMQMQSKGCTPCTDLPLHHVEDEEEHLVCVHN